MIDSFTLQCSYNSGYYKIYDTAYNQAFIFYDEDEEICLDEVMYCARQRPVVVDLLAASLADRQIS